MVAGYVYVKAHMRSLLFLACVGALIAGKSAAAQDMYFYEAIASCQTQTEAHPFQVEFQFDRSGKSVYELRPSSPFTACLGALAAAKADDLIERKLSLGATLARSAEECGRKYGKATPFQANFSLNAKGFYGMKFAAQPTMANQCMAMVMSLTQPFGASPK